MNNRSMEPIAIVGMGCRFPGAHNLEEFWTLLREGRDEIRDLPPDRNHYREVLSKAGDWEGKTSARGGFLEKIDEFDWRSFRISPRDAASMDPQHRLLLEVAWEALDDAGLDFASIAGSMAGVFIGIMGNDYFLMQSAQPDRLDGYGIIGNLGTFAANRISYAFDLRGPSLAINAACSSSLATAHQACTYLQSSGADFSLAGGVSLLLSPEITIGCDRAGILSKDNHCKHLDAAADGFVRSEGAGVVVLKRVSALKPSDRVYAILRGTGANHNGRNDWIMSTSQEAQEQLYRLVCSSANVEPSSIDFVEFHGTGTFKGDPVEAKAVGEVYGAHRPQDAPCLVGSVKTNLGHLDTAAGVAGVIKVALSLYNQEIPPNLHFQQAHPEIPLEALRIQPVTSLTPWPRKQGPARAAVSSFGLGGSNAHAILEAPAALAERELQAEPATVAIAVSARSAPAALALARSYHAWISSKESASIALQDIAYTSCVRRTHHEYRLAVVGSSREELAHALDAAIVKAGPALRRIDSGKARVLLLSKSQESCVLEPWRDLVPMELWRNSTDFDTTLREALQDGHRCFLDLDCAPGQSEKIRQELEKNSLQGLVLEIRQPEDPRERLEALAQLHAFGVPVSWERVYLETGARCISLPPYAWQRQRVWLSWLDAPPEKPASSEASLPHVCPLVFSAQTEQELQALATKLVSYLREHKDLPLHSFAHSLAIRSLHLPARVALCLDLKASRESVLESLQAVADGHPRAPNVLNTPSADPSPPAPLAMLFTGQGSQRLGMGRDLYSSSSAFREALDAIAQAFGPHLDKPLLSVMFAPEGSPNAELMDQTAWTQPTLFALEVALYRLWESWGIQPDFLLGHSIGELVAAHIAGVLTLPDACALVAARGRLMQELPPGGAMAALQASEEEVAAWLPGKESRLGIAGLNGPRSTVISGEESSVQEILAHFAALGRKGTRLRVSHAFHSPLMEGMLEKFEDIASRLKFHPPRIPIVSNVTGRQAGPQEITSPKYWTSQVRSAVRFMDGIQTLRAEGVTTFLELGPHGVLSAMAEDCLAQDAQAEVALIPTLRKDRDALKTITEALCKLYLRNAPLQWKTVFAFFGAGALELPRELFEPSKPGPLQPVAMGALDAKHPLLDASISIADPESLLLTGLLSLERYPWLAAHVVFDTVLLPGTAFLELALAAGARIGLPRLEEFTLEVPLILTAGASAQLQVHVESLDAAGKRRLSFHSRPAAGGGSSPWIRHAFGTLGPASGAAMEQAFPDWPPRDSTPLDLGGVYARLAEIGLQYGSEFQGLRGAWSQGTDLYAEVELPQPILPQAAGFGIHPALLDAALHVLGFEQAKALATGASTTISLPFSWAGVELRTAGANALRVRFTRPSGDHRQASLTIADGSGKLVATVENLSFQSASPEQIRQSMTRRAEHLYRVAWKPLPAAPRKALEGNGAWIGSLHPDLAEVPPRLKLYPTWAEFLRELRAGGSHPDWLVVSWSPYPKSQPPLAEIHQRAYHALSQIQEWLKEERLANTRLLWLTHRAISAHPQDRVQDLAHAALWGLARTAQNEHPDRRLGLLDVDEAPASLATLMQAIALDEPQIALRGGELRTPRLEAALDRQELAPPTGEKAWRLHIPKKGILEALAFVRAPEAATPLLPGEVRIEVRAAGLNFRDVMNALGMNAKDLSPLGHEAAGVVVEIGPGVSGLAPGDRVFGMVGAAFGPLARANHQVLARIPEDWTFAQAASVPIVFLTAYLGLVDLGGLKAGERVLIHAGAGGVGMAAIQIARVLGAEVFATASPGKWSVLRGLGLPDDHIASSRTLDFENQFRAATQGQGMDVVLNSLAREFVDASLRLLPRGGRFLEMGKTDLRAQEAVRNEHPGVEYTIYDLVDAPQERIGQMLQEILGHFASGKLQHLPMTSWDLRRAPEAFRHLAQARHVGKIVFTLPRPFDPEGTVLVTGASGALGSWVAEHLIERHGIRHLLLLSRQGMMAPEAAAVKASLEKKGALVTIQACDVAQRDALSRALASIPSEHPLTGIVHSAGVLDDGLLESLNPARMGEVFRAKVDAASHLHELTVHQDLSAFLLFSSVSGIIGNASQGNYAAANTFLDALASHRQGLGLPALSLAWGPWAGRGMAARLTEAEKLRLERHGIFAFQAGEGLALLDAALARSDALLVPVHFDGVALGRRGDSVQPILRSLAKAPARSAQAPAAQKARESDGLRKRLERTPPAEHQSLLLDELLKEVGSVLGLADPSSVPLDRPLQEFGLDSLMAVELRNRLSTLLEQKLPTTLLFDYPTPVALARMLQSKLVVPPKPEEKPSLKDEEIRAALASIPIQRLRDAGLLDPFLRLLQPQTGAKPAPEAAKPAPAAAKSAPSIDSLAVADLVNLALRKPDRRK